MKKIFFMMGVAALALSSCSQDEVINANNGKTDGNLITFRVRSHKPSRAMEFSTYNLDDFMVYGFKGSPDDGEEVVPYFLNGEPVKFSRDGILFTSATPYYYPTDGSWLYFAAYAPSSLTGFTVDKFGGLELKGFTVDADITKQVDLIFANGGSNLEPDEDDQELTFTHALTKVFVSAVNNSDERYKYEIVGVKIGNITNTGDFVYRGEKAYDEDSETINGTFRPDGYIQDAIGYGIFWKPAEAQTDEMVYIFDEPVVLDKDNSRQNLMSGDDTENIEGGKECFMLIPQKLSAKFVNEAGTLESSKFEAGMSYIAFLVRITNLITNEVVYPYAVDEETGVSKTEAISKEIDGVTYAWAAFPVSSLWIPGSYIDYYVDFSKGAGFVAPGADETIEFTPILGREIKFTEEVFSWDDGTEITVDHNSELGVDVGNSDDAF